MSSFPLCPSRHSIVVVGFQANKKTTVPRYKLPKQYYTSIIYVHKYLSIVDKSMYLPFIHTIQAYLLPQIVSFWGNSLLSVVCSKYTHVVAIITGLKIRRPIRTSQLDQHNLLPISFVVVGALWNTSLIITAAAAHHSSVDHFWSH